ncbi:hypothetical protein Y1Q_0001429 [Alligator mississippiensis]|uniref:Uncharacterized protein n=1 Tax=Alligator mississippiensis TaxID=8496 RepID=A0A151M9F8_ALLMI|nr:hypothetical protein Y1Q_0001429 [Alligator mississippiensis]
MPSSTRSTADASVRDICQCALVIHWRSFCLFSAFTSLPSMAALVPLSASWIPSSQAPNWAGLVREAGYMKDHGNQFAS